MPGVIISPESEMGKELAKFEQHHTRLVPDGAQPGNPYVYRHYPKMLYRARKDRSGRPVVMEPEPNPGDYKTEDYNRVVLMMAELNKSSQRIIQDEGQERVAKGQGWCESPHAALEAYEQQQQALAQAAAEAAYAVRRMSERAQDEFRTAEEATSQQVSDVPAPRRRRGRGRKPKTAVPAVVQE